MNQLYLLGRPLRKIAARVALFGLAMFATSLIAQAHHGQARVTDIDHTGMGTFTGSYVHADGPEADHPWFVFNANAGDVITINATTTFGGGAYGWLYRAPDGCVQVGDFSEEGTLTLVKNGGGSNPSFSLSYTVETTGQFALQLDSWLDPGNGTYSVTIAGSTATTVLFTPITPTASNGGVLTCTNPNSTITAPTGGTNYAFTGPNGFSQSGAANTASVSQPGTYTVVETISNSCPASGTVTITENKNPPTNVTLSNNGPLTCTKTSVTLTASSTGGSNYAFSGPNGFSQSGAATTASVTAPGTYSVVVTGTNGCSATAQTTTVTSDTAPPAANLTNNGSISANNPTVTLTASPGGTTYAFSAGASQQGGNGGNTATVTSPGAYQVTVTGSNGCTAVGQTTVLGGNSPTVCRGGTATISLVAGGSPAKYEWYKNSVNSARLSEVPYLQKGTTTASLTLINVQISADYYAKVTDANGSVVVYGPFHLTVDASCRARIAAEGSTEPGTELRVTLLGNPVAGDAVEFEVSGAAGESLRLGLLSASGRVVSEQMVRQTDAVGRYSLPLGGQPAGLLLLRVSTAGQSQILKIIRAN